MPIDDRADAVARSLDHGQQPYGVMIRRAAVEDRLGGQPDAQVAPRAGHHADPADHIVIDLAAASIDFVVDGREIVFHVDPLRHHERRRHDRFQQFSRRVRPVVV